MISRTNFTGQRSDVNQKSSEAMHAKGLDSISPHTTYRIQFHKDFNFSHLEAALSYLQQLGVDTIYASPILTSTPGSRHGYDGIDVNQLNPELGTLADLRRIRKKLDQYGIKWLQDIVPNHMAFHTANAWLMDILEFGKASRYKSYFDTCYHGNMFAPGKLMVPVLKTELQQAIKEGELAVVRHDDKLYLRYGSDRYPLSPESYCSILADQLKTVHNDFNGFLVQVNTVQANGNQEEWNTLRSIVFSHISNHMLEGCLEAFNNSPESLQELADAQFYELCPWWDTQQRINYRRFFTVNGLICLNVHDPKVFEQTHQLVRQIMQEGLIDGVRIDHIDGLYNPTQYLKDLRALLGPECYIVAEKILEQDEKLPQIWPIQGTTGYEFLSACNNLLTCSKGKKKLNSFYKQLLGEQKPLKLQELEKKKKILSVYMQGEIANLVRLLADLLDDKSNLNRHLLAAIVQAFLANFPVYRIYDDHFPLSRQSYRIITTIFKKLHADPDLDARILARVWAIFKIAQEGDSPTYKDELMQFLSRCMQFTGPVMAKGIEDTLMYTYNRFIGHNEVGDHPANFGISIGRFHKTMEKRQKYWPLSLSASSTHDTKRGEDARCRLSVLTAMAGKWINQVQIWQDIVWNEYRRDLPHPNDEYFIYQTLVSSYPFGSPEAESEGAFEKRFLDYLVKYLREGKERSSWERPNESYEAIVADFARFLLNKERPFFTSFYHFLQEIIDFGIINSLVLQVLKFTAPGVPDIYQGSEVWNHSFVDPDNRRPIDYTRLKSILANIEAPTKSHGLESLWHQRHNGTIKLALVRELTRLRTSCPTLSTESSYIKLKVVGTYKKNILAFARKYGDDWLVVVVPLHLAAIGKASHFVSGTFNWLDTKVQLPTVDSLKWQHKLVEVEGDETEIPVGKIIKNIPLALIQYKDKPKKRSAGVLMHLSSLPADYGIGDMGIEARRFVDQLQASGQSWWQTLPLGPTAEAQGHSPYSTLSAWAGNPLFIDLQALVKRQLLTKQELRGVRTTVSGTINFQAVSEAKYELLKKAYARSGMDSVAFDKFCHEEANWLWDFALFMVLKKQYNDQPWYEWPEKYSARNQESLDQFENEHANEIRMVKWWQYLFFQQWNDLRHYCTDRGIRLLGDIPFYVNYDSADVWANCRFFALDGSGKLLSIAGVPPDYFNDQGQLWGMPVYRWEILKKTGYRWWIERLRHSCKLFDQVRLDHFRAFSAYWEVAAGEQTAKNGQWSKGPGSDFFDQVKTELGAMPFVAEDLGDIDALVYTLRDRYHLPGMKVLQFAFGDDMARSLHTPHQYENHCVAYTGTHDNNTTFSWYNQEIDRQTRTRIDRYMGRPIDTHTVNESFIRMLYASVANTVIIPMQDILGLDGSCRMNRPASTAGNWLWRMEKQAFHKKLAKKLRHYTQIYNR